MGRILFTLWIVWLASVVAGQAIPKGALPKSAVPLTVAGFTEGRTIVDAVEFIGLDEGSIWDSDVEHPIFRSEVLGGLKTDKLLFEPGEKLNLRRVSKTLIWIHKDLFERGYLDSNVVAWGAKEPRGHMRLIFRIDRGVLGTVASVRFNKLRVFLEVDLQRVMQTCMGDSWGRLYMRHLDYCAQRDVRGFMQDAGYIEAKVALGSKRYGRTSVEIGYNVSEGDRFRVGEIKFEGMKVFTERELKEKLGLATGDIVNAGKLRDFVYTRLKDEYGNRGYLSFNAEWEPEIKKPLGPGMDGVVDCVVTIDEGRQFRLQSVEFSGLNPSEQKELTDAFPIKPGDIFDQSKLKGEIDRLNKLEKYKWIDIDRDVETRTDDESADIELCIKLTPRI